MGYMEGGGLISASLADQQDGPRPETGGSLGSLVLGQWFLSFILKTL